MDMNVKVIGIAITEDELQKMSLGNIIQKAIEAVQNELGISTDKDEPSQKASNITMKDKVFDTAMDLIDFNDETTTLEIKNTMRANGEWIKQSEVSQYMEELYNDGHFDFYNKDGHRVYFVNNDDDKNDDEFEDECDCNCDCNTNKTPARIKTHEDDDYYIIYDGEEEDGDWEVYYMGDIIYVDGNVTRSKARVIGSHVFDVDYDDVRACRYHEE